jgi:CRISPR-associated protein Cas5d
MFHGFDYPDEVEKDKFYARFWRPEMIEGVIAFVRPDDEKSIIRKFVRKMKASSLDTVGLEEEGLLEGYEERSV